METKQTSVNYQFTALPTTFIYLLDSDCLKLFCILLQKHSYWASNNKLNNGYFTKSITELSTELGLKNRKDVKLCIEALYTNGIIDVIVTNSRDAAKFKLNWSKIEELSQLSIFDINEFDKKITKPARTSDLTYTKCSTKCDTNCNTKCSTDCSTNCTTTLNKEDKIDKLNILNKEDILNNIDKEEYILSNNINEKAELVGVESRCKEQAEKTEIPKQVKETVKNKVDSYLIEIRQCSSMNELKDKSQHIVDWFDTVEKDGSISDKKGEILLSNAINETESIIKTKLIK